MLILKCTCGHRMKVAEDVLGRVRICTKCRQQIRVSEENTRPGNPGAPVRKGAAASDGQADGKKRIGELLVSEGIVSAKQLAEGLKEQEHKGGKLVEVMISMGFMSLQSFVNFLSKQPGVASIDLTNYEIPAEIISLIPKELALEHEVFPIDKMGRLLTLGMACPLDSSTIGKIEETTGLRVKALLCSPGDIRSAIKRYYPFESEDYTDMVGGIRRKRMHPVAKTEEEAIEKEAVSPEAAAVAPRVESALKLSGVSRLVQDLKSLPALPETVHHVRESMTDLSISPKDVAETIIKDPPIAAKVLSVANSAAYGFPNKVDSVDLAVALMGLKETYSIVLSAAVINIFEKTRNFDYRAYWEEAMTCAAAAKTIAKACNRERGQSVFTAGLLHDIGRIALLETVPELYANVSSRLVGEDLIRAEQEHIGLTHAEAGYELAINWNLPIEIAEPIRFHHDPEFGTEVPENVAIVSLAEFWTRTSTLAESSKEDILEESAASVLLAGMNLESASQAFDEVTEIERARFEWRESRSPV